jgi:hypothetical protein
LVTLSAGSGQLTFLADLFMVSGKFSDPLAPAVRDWMKRLVADK